VSNIKIQNLIKFQFPKVPIFLNRCPVTLNINHIVEVKKVVFLVDFKK